MESWPPWGIRVWWGYRHENFAEDRGSFDKLLSGIFIPQTWQQMSPLGLQAYYPALIPLAPKDQWPLPDEVALVHYPTPEHYYSVTRDTVAGRAYGLLHRTAFNFKNPLLPKSSSDFPKPWGSEISFCQPISLLDNVINWRLGVTRMLLARPEAGMSEQEYKSQINQVIHQWLNQKTMDSNVDGAIILVHRHWLCYWEHQSNNLEDRSYNVGKNSLLPLLRPFLQSPIIDKQAKSLTVPPLFTNPDEGVDMIQGDFFDVGFSEPNHS